ncbi:hypothetical protein TNCV_1988051 [Trichonephila clavipes]|nr:hypothetical protein TNCV_1988051 [Trichonephila clavipes]
MLDTSAEYTVVVDNDKFDVVTVTLTIAVSSHSVVVLASTDRCRSDAVFVVVEPLYSASPNRRISSTQMSNNSSIHPPASFIKRPLSNSHILRRGIV